jgi:hypothetical protein
MSWDDSGKMGVDDSHRLYWDGQEIVLTKKLKFTVAQRVLGVTVAVAAILASIAQFLPWLGFARFADLWNCLKSLG